MYSSVHLCVHVQNTEICSGLSLCAPLCSLRRDLSANQPVIVLAILVDHWSLKVIVSLHPSIVKIMCLLLCQVVCLFLWFWKSKLGSSCLYSEYFVHWPIPQDFEISHLIKTEWILNLLSDEGIIVIKINFSFLSLIPILHCLMTLYELSLPTVESCIPKIFIFRTFSTSGLFGKCYQIQRNNFISHLLPYFFSSERNKLIRV